MFSRCTGITVAACLASFLICHGFIGNSLAACVAPPTGVTSWWGGDNNALDIVGPHNGTLNGDTAYAAGRVGEAFSFDGAGDFVALPVSTDWDFGTGSFTLSAGASTGSDSPPKAPPPWEGMTGYK